MVYKSIQFENNILRIRHNFSLYAWIICIHVNHKSVFTLKAVKVNAWTNWNIWVPDIKQHSITQWLQNPIEFEKYSEWLFLMEDHVSIIIAILMTILWLRSKNKSHKWTIAGDLTRGASLGNQWRLSIQRKGSHNLPCNGATTITTKLTIHIIHMISQRAW
jgi:hypothetical protein